MMLFVIHYGNNDGVPERVENAIYALFLAGWFYHLTMLLSNINLDKFMIANYLQSAKGYLLLASILFVTVVTFTKAKNIKVMYNDIFRGTAYRYDQEMQQRYQKISTSTSDTVYVAPLKNIPLSLNFDEIKDTEKHLWNKCYATYFEKKVIILKE
jgi:Ni,Fe-hydrogenase I cytochrome b subunit